MQGRFFDGRRVEAALYTGKQRFRRSGAGPPGAGFAGAGAGGVGVGDEDGDLDAEGETSDAAEKKRLDEFANWLMTEGD